MIKLASVIPVHNRRPVTTNCLQRLGNIHLNPPNRSCSIDYTMIVVDDGSTDGTAEAIRDNFPDVVLLKGDGNLWWTGAINKGVQYCLDNGFDLIHIMNDDIEFEQDFLMHLMEASRPDRLVGSVTLLSDQKNVVFKAGMQETGKPHPRLADLYKRTQYSEICNQEIMEVAAISGRSLLIPKEVFAKIGLFDEKRLPHGYADMEFCLRAKENGIKVCINFRSKIYSSASEDKDLIAILKKSSRTQFAKSLFNLKYSWHIPSLFFFNILERNLLVGLTGFCHHALIILKWMCIKFLLPRNKFLQIVDGHNWQK